MPMIPAVFTTLALVAAAPPQGELRVTFPDQVNPNFYNVMTCRGTVKEQPHVRVAADGSLSPKSGSVRFHCDGPLVTRVQRIPFEPKYSADSAWAFAFEDTDGNPLLAGSGAKLMRPTANGLSFYVREGYQNP